MFLNSQSNVETNVTKSLQFGIYSEQDILKSSVCEVSSLLIYDKSNGLPLKSGLNDPWMGVTQRNIQCQTCCGDMRSCPGHFGHISLAEQIYHPQFLETIYKVLKSVCFNCSKLLIDPEKLPEILQIKNPEKRLTEIAKTHSNRCGFEDDPGCDFKQPKYALRKYDILIWKNDTEYGDSDEDSKRILRASEAFDILKEINDETIYILGMSPQNSWPQFMIIRKLIVVPPCVRPSIQMSSSARAEDDLTHLYQSILSTNKELEKEIEAGQTWIRVNEIISRLQQYVAFLMDNSEGKAKQKGGRPIKSISQRLKGKEGRLRGNLMGKRVDFSSRTVVSPDPSLELDQLGVPQEIAKELTIPERVTQLNIDNLRELVNRGDEWPGARYYISKVNNNEITDLNFVKSKPTLQYGDIVERHLNNDDWVVFNRQPSLHKMSLMGHWVKVLPGQTFRLNLAVTTPYNADFDGDEMNMHVPQNLESITEVKHLMGVPKQIISPQSNRPVMGLNQDSLLGIRLFTLRDNFLTKSQIFDIFMRMDEWDGRIPQPAIIFPKPLWTGKQILSMIIPKLNYQKFCDDDEFHAKDNSVVIKKGELLIGTLNKGIVGPTRGSLIGVIWIDFGPEATRQFLTFSQKMIICWMVSYGWTVSMGDTIIPVELMNKIEEKRIQAKLEFYKVLQDTQKENKKLIIHQPGKTIIQSFENKVNSILNDCRAQIGKLLNENVGVENHIKNMIISGSKGNNINISQISGLVGQQNVEGQRVPFGFNNWSLPCFLKNDFGPESRGFVANSYYKGLTPEEFYFHTMGGREGIIDTAVKTSQTGYIQRRLVKALEDVVVSYDKTVRDSQGNIVQFLYGEDGIAAEFIENQKFDILSKTKVQMIKENLFFTFDEESNDMGFEDSVQKLYRAQMITRQTMDELLTNKQGHAILYEELRTLLDIQTKLWEGFAPGQEIGVLPVNINRIISMAKNQIDSSIVTDLSPIAVIEKVTELFNRLEVIKISSQKEMKNFSQKINHRAMFLFWAFVLYNLSSKKVILRHKLNSWAFDFIIHQIENDLIKSLISPGEMCGSIAAQSLGETLTQMTLNTFHFAGVSSQNITLGVPRIQELINVAKNIKGPYMTLYLDKNSRFDSEAAHNLISYLEFTTLNHLIKNSEIYFDPKNNETVVTEDQELLFLEEEIDVSPWVLRLTLDPIQMNWKAVGLKEVIQRIRDYFPDTLQIIESLETDDPIVIRLRLLQRSQFDFFDIKKIEQFLLYDLAIKGFCKKVSYRKNEVKMYSDYGVVTEGPKEGEFVLETTGTNLSRVLKLKGIDWSKTTSNHITDIYLTLGIEAARQAIINEINLVFQFFNIQVNDRHVSLLAEGICLQGKLMAISRNGINRVYSSPFRKSSFEETVDILIKAAAFSNLEPLKGVTENLMMGQLCKLGTGYFDIIMDTDYLLASDENYFELVKQWSYFPEINPPIEVLTNETADTAFQTPTYKFMKTPQYEGGWGTPLMGRASPAPAYSPGTNKYRGFNSPIGRPMQSPGGMNMGQYNQTPQQAMRSPNYHTPLLGANYQAYQGFNPMNSQLVNQNYLSPGAQQPYWTPLSPHQQQNYMSGYAGVNTGQDMKYSPMTPNQGFLNPSSPSISNTYYKKMSPSFQYPKSELANSPDSNLSSDVINSQGSGLNYNSQFESDPQKHFDLFYENQSPSIVKKEEEK